MNDKFINIIINGNSMSQEELTRGNRGYVVKRFENKILSSIDQTIILVNSIQQNWKFPHKIYFMHSYPLYPFDQKRLQKLGITVLHRPSNSKFPGLAFANRCAAYLEPMEGTHRLVLDSDMLALREPVFDFSYDVLATPGKSMWNASQWDDICKIVGTNLPSHKIKKESKENSAYSDYYRGESKYIFPYFNHGAILSKVELGEAIGTKFIKYRDLLAPKIPHYHGQIAIGLAIKDTTSNWGILPKGFNYLATMEENVRYPVDQISLFHYLGAKGGKQLQRYKRFFKNI